MVDDDPELSIGRDGAGLFGGNDAVLRFTAGSTVAAPIEPPIGRIAALVSVERDRAVIVDAYRTIFFGGASGFAAEYSPPIGLIFDLGTAGGDGSQLLVGGTIATLLRRDEGNGEWSSVELPADRADTIEQIAALEGGRIAIITASGELMIYLSETWCSVPGSYSKISVSPSGRTIYLTGPQLTRIRL